MVIIPWILMALFLPRAQVLPHRSLLPALPAPEIPVEATILSILGRKKPEHRAETWQDESHERLSVHGVRNICFQLQTHCSVLSLCCLTHLLMGHFTSARAVRFSLVCASSPLIQRVLHCWLPFSQTQECSELVLTGSAAPGFLSA